mgnify:CR=1 FL=1
MRGRERLSGFPVRSLFGYEGLARQLSPNDQYLFFLAGELATVYYDVSNTRDRKVIGQAIPSYAPSNAASFFRKIECFCFSQQTLGAGEVKRFPVVFVLDPNLPKDVNTITLSYTFFEVPGSVAGGS